jgi:aryl-alcohol dehydrogenase-like predicted oxidoreductase
MTENKARRELGKTGIMISPVGVGVMQFAGGKGFFRFMYADVPQADKDEIVKTALENGVNWFDTAEIYGMGRSERTFRQALVNNNVADEDVLIATKWWPAPRFAASIGRTIGNRLRNLVGYTIDLHQVHQQISFSPVEDQMNAMADLVEAGKIRSVGISNFDAAHTRQAHAALEKRGLPLASNQVHFCLTDRSIETSGVLDAAKELGVTIIAWSPLASGLLSGKYHKNPDALAKVPVARRGRFTGKLEETRPLIEAMDEMAQKYGVTVSQVALNWTVNFHGETVVAIPGASKPYQAKETAGVLDFTLTAEEMGRLDELTRRYR